MYLQLLQQRLALLVDFIDESKYCYLYFMFNLLVRLGDFFDSVGQIQNADIYSKNLNVFYFNMAC